jgi:hypothetical protein
MTIFDLLFLLAVLAAVVSLATAVVFALLGQRARALKVVWGLVYGAGAYFATGVAVAYFAPPEVVKPGAPWCFDDWCLTVEKATPTPRPPQVSYKVDLLIESRARRVAQRASGAWIYLIDDRGRLYPPEAEPSKVRLDVQLQPGESVTTSRAFIVPSDAHKLGLITGHGGSYCGAMDALIIGRGGCWFRKPAMIRIR